MGLAAELAVQELITQDRCLSSHGRSWRSHGGVLLDVKSLKDLSIALCWQHSAEHWAA